MSVTLHPNRQHFTLDGEPLLVASHGNVVTAIPGHSWEEDLAILVAQGARYGRLWHILAQDTLEWPWLRLPDARWDLSQFNETYWSTIRSVLERAESVGVVLEPHLFDRGCGGNQADYRAYPWHPRRNVNGLRGQLPQGGTGLPQFYEARPGTPLFELQASYVRKWVDEARPFRNVVLEIENEHRQHDVIRWAAQWARLIKILDPERMVSYSSLESDLERAYRIAEIDIVNVHSGREGRDPQVLRDYLTGHFRRRKLMNVDEFANGERSAKVLRRQCWTIVTSGGHFHIEDALPESQPEIVAANVRRFLAESRWDFTSARPRDGAMRSATQLVAFLSRSEVQVPWAGTARVWDPVGQGAFGPAFSVAAREIVRRRTDTVLFVERVGSTRQAILRPHLREARDHGASRRRRAGVSSITSL